MTTLPTWLALALFLAAAATGLILAYSGPPPAPAHGARPRWWAAAALAALAGGVCLAVTAPWGGPFQPGMRLGWGGLLGAEAVVLGALFLPRLPAGPLALLLPIAWAGLAAPVALLVFGGYPQPALYGVALGALAAGAVLRLAGAGPDAGRDWARVVERAALFSATAAAAALLTAMHFRQVSDRVWWGIPLLLAALVTALLAVLAALQAAAGSRFPTRAAAVAACLVYLGLAAAVSWYLAASALPWWLALGGLVAFAVVAALAAVPLAGPTRALLGGLVVVTLLAGAFRIFAGAGEAMALVAGWMVFAAAWPRERSRAESALAAGLTLGLVALGYRLLSEGAPEQSALAVTMHYGFIGVIVGLLVPLAVSRIANKTRRGLLWALPLLALALLAALAAPVLMLTWGYVAAFGLLAGLAAACALAMAPDPRLVLVIPAGMALVAGAVAPLIATLELTRLQRGYVLGVVIIVGLLLLAIAGVAARRRREA